MEFQTYFLIIHLFGIAIGAGGAFLSDLMFLKSIRDETISKTEFSFLSLGSRAVWAGLFILAISGAGLFFLDVEKYISSSKFLAKMSIIAVIIVNGIVFHTTHIPRILRHRDHHFPSSDEFMRKRSFLLASGAISFTSWSFAIVLGAMKHIPYSYSTLMLAYILVVCMAVSSAYFLKNRIFPSHRKA